MKQLLQEFRDSHAEDMTLLDEAMAANDRSTARRLAHTLKSSGATLGALDLSKAARDLEDAFDHSDGQDLEALIEAVRREMGTVLESLQALLSA